MPRRSASARRLRFGAAALRAAGLHRRPPPPAAELHPRGRRRHTKRRDAEAVRHHYDVSNEFFALFLDETMTYSCALFEAGTETLEDAQRAKLELICRKLELEPGQRMLDIGCGWGSLAIHAAREHGASVWGITLSEPQAELARERAREAGVGRPGRVQGDGLPRPAARSGSTRSPASAWSSTSARRRSTSTRAQIARVLEPGGRVLNHGIVVVPPQERGAHIGGEFSNRYVFPDGELLNLSRMLLRLRARRLRGAQRREPAHRLRRDAAPLDDPVRGAPRRGRAAGGHASACGSGASTCAPPATRFETGSNAVYQLLCSRPLTEGASPAPTGARHEPARRRVPPERVPA